MAPVVGAPVEGMGAMVGLGQGCQMPMDATHRCNYDMVSQAIDPGRRLGVSPVVCVPDSKEGTQPVRLPVDQVGTRRNHEAITCAIA
jgi:hypothetical protein